MTNSERVEAVCNELFNADVWVGDNIKSSKVAAFIVERDAKRDAAWARFALTLAATSTSKPSTVTAHETARQVLYNMGIDVGEVLKAVAP